MGEIKLRRDKANLMDMIRHIHKRKTWGKKYAYATCDEHTIWITIKEINFSVDIIVFELFWEELHTTTMWKCTSSTEVLYFMNKRDYPIEDLIRNINRSIISLMQHDLRRFVRSLAENTEEFLSIWTSSGLKIKNEIDLARQKYANDFYLDDIIEAISDKLMEERKDELTKLTDIYFYDHENEHITETYNFYMDLLKENE